MEVSYGPRSIGCPLKEEETYDPMTMGWSPYECPLNDEEETCVGVLHTMEVPYGPRYIGCPLKEDKTYGIRAMGWPPY